MFELECLTFDNKNVDVIIYDECTPGWKCNPDYCNPNFK